MSKISFVKVVYPAAGFFLILIWGYWWSKFGIDLTDEGAFLYTQRRILWGGMPAIGPQYLYIGSDLLGSLWLSLIGDASLREARFGSYILRAIIFLLSFATLVNIGCGWRRSFVFSLFAFITYGAFSNFVITYDLAPILPLMLGLFFLTLPRDSLGESWKIFFLGISLILVLLTRVPLAVMLFFIVLILYRQSELSRKCFLISFFGGALTCLLFLLTLPELRISIALTIEAVTRTIFVVFFPANQTDDFGHFSSFNYSAGSQIYFWAKGYLRVFAINAVLIAPFYLALKYKKIFIVKILTICMVLVLCAFVLLKLNQGQHFLAGMDIALIQRQIIPMYLIPSLSIGFFLILAIYYQKVNLGACNLPLILLLIIITFPLGSNSFEKKLYVTQPLVLPFIIFYVVTIKEQAFNLAVATKSNFIEIMLFIYKWVFCALFLTLFLSSIRFGLFESNFQFLPTKYAYEMKADGVHGIRELPSKGQSIDATLHILKANSSSSVTLLSLGQIVWFNYISSLNGVFEFTWPSYWNPEYLSARLLDLKAKNLLPSLVLINIYDPRYYDWDRREGSIDINKDNMLVIQKFLDKNNYFLLEKTDEYLLYKKAN